jgi:hypothetical protein
VPVKRPRVPLALGERPEGILCITAEANAWPYRSVDLRTSYREELVHFIAHRPATGETLDVIVRPRNPLAPSTPPHVALSAEELTNGAPLSELFERWRAFVRDDDIVCSWGHYAVGIFLAAAASPDGAQPAATSLPSTRLDLRQVSRVLLEGRAGTMDAVLEKLAIDASGSATLGRGRAGVRAAQLARIALHLGTLARAARLPQ